MISRESCLYRMLLKSLLGYHSLQWWLGEVKRFSSAQWLLVSALKFVDFELDAVTRFVIFLKKQTSRKRRRASFGTLGFASVGAEGESWHSIHGSGVGCTFSYIFVRSLLPKSSFSILQHGLHELGTRHPGITSLRCGLIC